MQRWPERDLHGAVIDALNAQGVEPTSLTMAEVASLAAAFTGAVEDGATSYDSALCEVESLLKGDLGGTAPS
jgi:hypothetical protein